jgi:hypothetical protein
VGGRNGESTYVSLIKRRLPLRFEYPLRRLAIHFDGVPSAREGSRPRDPLRGWPLAGFLIFIIRRRGVACDARDQSRTWQFQRLRTRRFRLCWTVPGRRKQRPSDAEEIVALLNAVLALQISQARCLRFYQFVYHLMNFRKSTDRSG